MPLNRKTFIRYASALAAVSCCPDTSIWKTNPVIAAPANPNPDEAYWSAIRAAFPLSREWTYLNNGTMGPSPYPVIEAVHRGMMESDQHGTYFGYEDSIAPLAKFVGADKEEIALTHNVT